MNGWEIQTIAAGPTNGGNTPAPAGTPTIVRTSPWTLVRVTGVNQTLGETVIASGSVILPSSPEDGDLIEFMIEGGGTLFAYLSSSGPVLTPYLGSPGAWLRYSSSGGWHAY